VDRHTKLWQRDEAGQSMKRFIGRKVRSQETLLADQAGKTMGEISRSWQCSSCPPKSRWIRHTLPHGRPMPRSLTVEALLISAAMRLEDAALQ
jgi:hypothetical protein